MILTSKANIPLEMRLRPQWVAFDVTKDGKTPYIPGTDKKASPNRPAEWRTFERAWQDVEDGSRTHVAFCFSQDDPYVFIDLDDPESPEQTAILERFDTYAQTSVSGTGIHILCKGSFEGAGKHPHGPGCGMFQQNRFCVMTGAVIDGRDTIKRVSDDDLQSVHTWLSAGKRDMPVLEIEELESDIPDMTIFEMGCDRFNRYRNLSNGRWQQYEDYHNDHSTADHAFIAMLCDLTESNAQVRRMFAYSGMWTAEREAKKAAHGGLENYVNRSIKKVRTNQKWDRDLEREIPIVWPGSQSKPSITLLEKKIALPETGKRDLIDAMPPGLMRELAEYSFKTSFHPLQEASVCGALMFYAGFCGRGFLTPTKSGLNQWIILVGGTSCGKDEYQAFLKRAIHALSKTNNNCRKIFGGEIVSGAGLETTFQETLRFISYIPEFGDTFRNLGNPHAPDYVRALARGLLNSYNSAGVSGSSEGRRKAQGSDEKTFVERPCLSLAGEATPESLYGNMSSRELSTGLLQRFILVDVAPSSWSLYENPLHGAALPEDLRVHLDRMLIMLDSYDQQGKYKIVKASKSAAETLKDYRETKRRAVMSTSEGLPAKEAINRAGLKVLRLASSAAVSYDFDEPVIRDEHALWAIDFIEKTDAALLSRFTSGDIGSGQVKQESEILRAFHEILELRGPERRKLGLNARAEKDGYVSYQALRDRVVNLPSFAQDKSGAVTAFDRCMESMFKSGGKILKVPQEFAAEHLSAGKTLVVCGA